MKLTEKKIEETIIDVAGEEGLRLVKELRNKENISEFTLANKLKRDIKLIRHILYKLSNYNLVSSTRKKDKQKGWYIYYWTVIPENVKFLYLKKKRETLQRLKEHLVKEQTEQIFACPKICVRLDFDQAMDFEFRCPECGDLLSQDQNPERFTRLQKKIKEIEDELKSEEIAVSSVKSKVVSKPIKLKKKAKGKIKSKNNIDKTKKNKLQKKTKKKK